jgi:hypothetical protein
VPLRRVCIHTDASREKKSRTRAIHDSREDFVEYHPVTSRSGNGAGGSTFSILATGKVRKSYTHLGNQHFVTFDALHTPDLRINLISVSHLDEKGFSVEFNSGKVTFKTPSGVPFMDGMYRLDFNEAGVTVAAARSRDIPASRGTWHPRLGHIGLTGLDMLISGQHVNGLSMLGGDVDGLCEDCLYRKQTRCLFDGVHEVEHEVGERVYMDLWGPAATTGIGGAVYLFHIVDGHTGGPWVFFLSRKTAEESLTAFVQFKAELETQTGKILKRIRVDGVESGLIAFGMISVARLGLLLSSPLPIHPLRTVSLSGTFARPWNLAAVCCQILDCRNLCGQRCSEQLLTSSGSTRSDEWVVRLPGRWCTMGLHPTLLTYACTGRRHVPRLSRLRQPAVNLTAVPLRL